MTVTREQPQRERETEQSTDLMTTKFCTPLIITTLH